jgi:DNA-binding transcriptional MerR regulator
MTDQMDSGTGLDDVIWAQGHSEAGSGSASTANPDEPLSIGTIAREFNVTLRAIRFYESKGLLKPQRDGKTRIYGPADRERLALILKGKHLGFTLSEIRALLASKMSSYDNDAGPLGLSREQCSRQIDTLERQKRDIEDAIAELQRAVADTHVPSPRLAAGT